jgi:integrase/recombinase XerD
MARASYGKVRLPKYLTEDQVRLLFQKIPVGDREEKMAFRLMYAALLRVSEVCKLRVRNINFVERIVAVRDSKGGDRNVHMGSGLTLELQKHLEGRGPTDWVARPTGTAPFTRFQLDKRLAKYAKDAGLTPGVLGFRLHCHTLRHSGARELLRKDLLNVNDIKQMLGHKDLATTTIYLATLGEEIREKLKRGELTVD